MFNIAAGLSLLLCVGVGVLWWRSYPYQVYYSGVTKQFDEHTVQGLRGRIVWSKFHVARSFRIDELAETPTRDGGSDLAMPIAKETRGSSLTVEWTYGWGTVRLKSGAFRYPVYRTVSVHLGLLLVLAGLLPAAWVMRLPARRRRWRIARGLCGRCGYDLRASAERCPECGAAAPIRGA